MSGILALIAIPYFIFYMVPHQEDLLIYIAASKAASRDQNFYEVTNNAYVYGPLLGIALTTFSELSTNTIKVIWFIFNFNSLIVIVIAINSLREKTKRQKINPVFMSILILTSFSFRSNLGQGQLVPMLSALCLTAFCIFNSNIFSWKRYLLATLLLLPVFEVKPYLFVGVLAYFLYEKKYNLILCFTSLLVIANVIYFHVCKITYIDWWNALKVRANSIDGGFDQASLQSILINSLNLSQNTRLIVLFVYYLFIISIIKIKKNSLLRIENRLAFFLVLPTVVSPFLHPHDMLFGLMGLLLIVEVKRESREAILKLLFLASVLHVAWTSQQLIGGLFIQLLFSVSMKVSYPKELKIQTWLTMNVLMAALLAVSYYSFPGHTDKINFYHMQTFLVLFIWFVVAVLHSEKSRNLAENH